MKNKETHTLNINMDCRPIRGWYVAILLFLILCRPSFGQSSTESIAIEEINIKEANNTIVLLCSFTNADMVDKVENKSALLRLDIHKGDTIFDDAIITKKERYSENELLISVRPPLAASIYKTRKYEFILQLQQANRTLKSRKSAVLGSAFKTFDLRPYTNKDPLHLLITIVLLFIVFSVVLFLIKPLRKKYRFKRDHIMEYGSIGEDGRSGIDPFTFVTIEDHDKVVIVEDNVILLSSWKRLKKLPETKPSQTHAMFFDQTSRPSFFNPRDDNFGKSDRAWYGLIGIFSGWLIYRLFLYLNMAPNQSFLAFFNEDGLQVSTVIAHDLLLGMTVGLCYTIVLAVVDQFCAKKGFLISGLAKIILPRAIFISSAFFGQALITLYLIENPFINGLIAWGLLGIAFIVPLNFKQDFGKKFVCGLGIGILSFAIYLIMGVPFLRDLGGTNAALFVGLALLGCLGPIMRNSPISRKHVAQLKEIRFDRTLFKSGKQKRSAHGKMEQKNDQILQESLK